MKMIRFGAVLALAFAAGGAQAVQVADWRFQGTLADSIGAPALTPVIAMDGAFVTDAVGPDPARMVRTFGAGGGFSVSSTGLIDDTGYTLAVLLRFDFIAGYARIFDTFNGTSDNGLYVLIDDLALYPVTDVENGAFGTDTWHQVVFVREGTGMVRGYIDGVLQFSALDDEPSSTIRTPDNQLRFFVDDGGENSPGAVARIRLWNTALPEAQIMALDDNQSSFIFMDGFESF